MHINKVSHVFTLDRVARDLGEDKGWLFDIAAEMEPEDGRVWVCDLGEHSEVLAFTDFGIESLKELIQIHKENAKLLRR
jgi:hypothetical protein